MAAGGRGTAGGGGAGAAASGDCAAAEELREAPPRGSVAEGGRGCGRRPGVSGSNRRPFRPSIAPVETFAVVTISNRAQYEQMLKRVGFILIQIR